MISFHRNTEANTLAFHASTLELSNETKGSLRLVTLTLIRWFALAGQALALLTVHFGFGYPVPLEEAFIVIGASLFLNLIILRGHRASVRLGESAAAAFLAFDILQLAALLYLTGGLENPFSFLLLAPVAVSATILSVRSIVLLCALSIVCITLIGIFHYPLPWIEEGFSLPKIYVQGVWVALVIGIFFFAIYTWRVAEEARRMSSALAATQLALSREQQLAAVGGLAAAAAHELGSPLGTIAVASGEISRSLSATSPIYDDVQLLISETARCRNILSELSEKSQNEIEKGSSFVRLPISVLIDSATARHRQEEIQYIVKVSEKRNIKEQPLVVSSPEIIHGLGNIIQNATQFAKSTVSMVIDWDSVHIWINIYDDGPGFPVGLLERLGEPYISSRSGVGGHMGLGVFIATILLRRSGAKISYLNRVEGGAMVELVWRREWLEEPTADETF